MNHSSSWRILDANANRALEGLRVVEEFVRFDLDDAHLTRLYKQLRHDLATVLDQFPNAARVTARETQQDVGTTIGTQEEYERASSQSLLLANQKRVEQSLRCLEEYGKLLAPESAKSFELLRYRAYTLAKAVATTAEGQSRLRDAVLYVLLDGRGSLEEFESVANQLVQAQVDIVQLRDKRLNDRELLTRARALRAMTRGTQTLFVVNDRPDLAVLTHADGVHVGQEELTVKDVRQIVGVEMLVGVSTHSIDQARSAVLDGASYLGCGPTFPSRTKSFDKFAGVDFLRQVAAEIQLPAFAIGGITTANVKEVRSAGFRRIAVRDGLFVGGDLRSRVEEYRQALQ